MILQLPQLDFASVESLLQSRFAEDSITRLNDLPLPESLENLAHIAKEITEAIAQKWRIAIVGDYDVDGVVSCAILHAFFKKINYPIQVEIPNRFADGYGLSQSVIARLDCDMIITVDNGINAIEAAQICKERGIKLIITDHHTPQEVLPDALICNPKLSKDFPEPEICGACVAWYLCAALKAQMGLNIQMVEFLDLLSLAIVSDVMPLKGVNRVLLKKGLEVLAHSKRLALIQLKEKFSKHKVDAQLIGYYIAPLLNCAGRMDSAMLAYKFLVTEDKVESKRLLKSLVEINTKRKALQQSIYEEAKAMFCREKDYAEIPFILVFNSAWHEGIIGIIAARLSEEFLKPSIVLTLKDGILKGSMRSTHTDCMEVLESAKEYLCEFGGHFGAAGLSLKLENLEAFRDSLMRFEYNKVHKDSAFNNALGYLSLHNITPKLFTMVQSFAPFGNGNAIPKFYVQAKVVNVRHFGAGHSQITLQEKGSVCNALVFHQDLSAKLNQEIACLYTLQWDSYAKKVILYVEHYI